MTDLVIVGAGVAGLACAAIARKRGLSVVVVEAGGKAGGLWKSTSVSLGEGSFCLDEGLRLPVTSGIPDVDDAIFRRPDFDFEWTELQGWPREGGITRGRFDAQTSCLDATTLGGHLSDVVCEMRDAPLGGPADNALNYSLSRYGETLTRSLVSDAVLGLFETDLALLEPSAVGNFIPRRILLGDRDETARLLADCTLEGRVAHARHADLPKGMSRRFMFPGRDGVSTWIDALTHSLAEDGVDFIFNDGLKKVHCHAGRITEIELKSDRRIRAFHVVSTIPSSLFGMAAGAAAPPMPEFRHLKIAHVLLDRAPAHQAQYVLNFDRKPSFFRAIFHENLGDVPGEAHVVTFEHLVTQADGDETNNAIADCIGNGALAPDTILLDHKSTVYRNIIPVPTLEYGRSVTRLRQDILDPIENLNFIGRAAGAGVFVDGIIQEGVNVVDTIAGVRNA